MDRPDRDVQATLAHWGLTLGRVVWGWEITNVGRSAGENAIVVEFTRDAEAVKVRFRSTTGEPCIARFGRIDVSHSDVKASMLQDVGELARRVTRGLARPGVDEALARLLAVPIPRRPVEPIEAGVAYAGSEAPELDPARRTDPERPFMQFDTIDLEDIGQFPDALRQMYNGTLGGLVIRGVYSKDAMATVMERLTAGELNYPRTSFPAQFKAHFFGRCLDGSDPELTEYLPDATRFRDETLTSFRDFAPFESRMEEMFRALSGGRSVGIPRFRDGRAYTPATIRYLHEGGQIGTHCGNEASTRAAYTHLNSILDRGDQISYFLTLQEPVRGGELIVYSLKWSDIDASHIVGGRSQVNDLLVKAEWLAVAPTAGDLLLFDGGRYFHRVAKVHGGRDRWTIGGFMMFDQTGDPVYYWS